MPRRHRGAPEPPDDARDPKGRPKGAGPGPSAERQAIERLLTERGIGRHALFLTQREGTQLSGGLESVSGFVLDDRGRVYGFWLACDEHTRALTLQPFYPVESAAREFANDAEYQAARRALGLP